MSTIKCTNVEIVAYYPNMSACNELFKVASCRWSCRGRQACRLHLLHVYWFDVQSMGYDVLCSFI